ncbi:hypothetical protein ABVK25_004484 [Lepraria finkii]|uniref:Uncharacterized protein n=1 Tax=Lepraria finkii TaxID=1340010 RepID=A0ABR4BDN9_9LECA
MNGSIVRQQNYLTGQKTPYARTGRRLFRSTITAASGDSKMETRPVSFSVHCLSDLRPMIDAIKRRWRGRNITNHSAVRGGVEIGGNATINMPD